MKFVVFGLSHHTAPIEVRERFAQRMDQPKDVLSALLRLDLVKEECLLATCNRVEFYVAGSESDDLVRSLTRFMEGLSGFPREELVPHLYRHEGQEGLKHVFRVAASLDSMVIGEPQILGQVKSAFQVARDHGTVGSALTRVFEKSFSVAKKVRTETGIAENAISMSFAAVELGREIFDTLAGKHVLLVGAGKMATLAAKHLRSYGVESVRIVSRSLETAQKLASEVNGLASSLSDLPILLNQADIVISSTAASGFVVDFDMMAPVVRERRYRPILFIDIAVPRDVDPRVSDLDNVFRYDVDDLKSVLELNREARAREAAAAEILIAEELAGFIRWSRAQEIVPVIKALRHYTTEIVQAELDRTVPGLTSMDPKAERRIQAMGQAIINKVLHPVLAELKREGQDGDPSALCEAILQLFPIDPEAFRTDGLLSSDLVEDDREQARKILPFRGKKAQAKGDS